MNLERLLNAATAICILALLIMICSAGLMVAQIICETDSIDWCVVAIASGK